MKATSLLYALALAGSSLFLPTSSLSAQVAIRSELNFQAVLRDPAGNLIGADEAENYSILLKIWNSPSSTEVEDLLWAESYLSTVSDGRFSVLMGTGAAFGDLPNPSLSEIINGQNLYVELSYTSTLANPTAADFTAMSTRQQITPSAMSLKSKRAELAEGLLDELRSELAREFGSPAGSVTAWAGLPGPRTAGTLDFIGVPDGWLLCDGRSVLKADYPNLYQAIGVIYGGTEEGDSFSVPDYRGRFLRAHGLGAGQDPDRTSRPFASDFAETHGLREGSTQTDQFRRHNHGINVAGSVNGDPHLGDRSGSSTDRLRAYWRGGDNAGSTGSNGGNETRPRNTYIHYIIKAN